MDSRPGRREDEISPDPPTLGGSSPGRAQSGPRGSQDGGVARSQGEAEGVRLFTHPAGSRNDDDVGGGEKVEQQT